MLTWDDLPWDEALTRSPYKPQPELPEDVLFLMMKKQPKLADLINHFNLEMEY